MKVFDNTQVVAFRKSIANAVGTCIRHAMRAEDLVEDLIIQQVHRVDLSKKSPFAQKETIHYILRTAAISACIPIAFIVISSLKRKVKYIVTPGSAMLDLDRVKDKDALAAIEENLGYTFEDKEDLTKALLDVEKKGRMSWLGEAVVQLIVAEHEEHTNVDDEHCRANMTCTRSEMNGAACAAGLDVFVKQGPGARSERVVDAMKADMLYAIVAMIYLRSNGSMESVKKVWSKVVALQN